LDSSKSLSPSIDTPDDKDENTKKGNEKHDPKGSGKAGPTGSANAK
jgi:hypothetical protein